MDENSMFDVDSLIEDVNKYLTDMTMDKSILHDNGLILDFSNIHTVPEGRFTVYCNDIRLENLYISEQTSDKLLVVLDGSRSRKGKIVDVPKFDMWSWQKKMRLNYLFIEDPMYFKYTDPVLHTGWYYGDNEVDYRYIVAQLIIKIAKIKEIEFIIYIYMVYQLVEQHLPLLQA